MKKLLSSLSLVALAFCSTSPSAFAMEELEVAKEKSRQIATRLYAEADLTDEILMQCTQLTDLDLGDNKILTNKSVNLLTNLTELDLRKNPNITIEAHTLPKLKKLSVRRNGAIKDEDFRHLPHLKELSLFDTVNITGNSLKYCTSLITLRLARTTNITDDAIRYLTSLQRLYIKRTPGITIGGLLPLTNLKRFTSKVNNITNDDIIPLDLTRSSITTIEEADDDNVPNELCFL